MSTARDRFEPKKCRDGTWVLVRWRFEPGLLAGILGRPCRVIDEASVMPGYFASRKAAQRWATALREAK